jgi:hypothetical protein
MFKADRRRSSSRSAGVSSLRGRQRLLLERTEECPHAVRALERRDGHGDARLSRHDGFGGVIHGLQCAR